MRNKVWVTWKSSTGEDLFDKVTKLAGDSDVTDLRKAFVEQQNFASTSPGTLPVFEREDGEKLKAGKELKDYFTAPAGSASEALPEAMPGPGKSVDTALVVAFPPPQQQQNGKLRCCFCILVCKCCFSLIKLNH